MKLKNKYSFGRYQGDLKEIIIDQETYSFDRQKLASKFAKGEFPVIICSDAASEGLNLQKANVIINVDVPWNPARLLQRFGRIDRFGQKKEKLYFYNLYYPNTVEDRIYTRLIERNIGFRQILGLTPEITSSDHTADLVNREIREPYDQREYFYNNSLIALTAEHDQGIHLNLLEKIKRSQSVSLSSIVVNSAGAVQEGCIQIDKYSFRFSTSMMDKDYLNFNHPFFHFLTKFQKNGAYYNLQEIRNHENQLLLYCIVKSNQVFPIISLTVLTDYLILSESIQLDQLGKSFDIKNLEMGVMELLNLNNRTLLNHNFINFDGKISDMYKGLILKETEILICAN